MLIGLENSKGRERRHHVRNDIKVTSVSQGDTAINLLHLLHYLSTLAEAVITKIPQTEQLKQ